MRCDAHRPGVAVFVDVSRRSDAAHRGAAGRAPPRGPRRAGVRALRPARSPLGPAAHGCPPAAARGSRLARPAGPHDRLSSPTARSRTCAPSPHALTRCARSSARGGSTSSTSTSRSRPPSAGTRSTPRSRRSSAPSTATRRTRLSHGIANGVFGARRRSTACTSASPSPRPRRGPASASTAAATASSPTASTCPSRGPARRPAPTAARCGSRSSARPSSARACPILLRAFEALREHVPVELTIVGASERRRRAAAARPRPASACSARSTTSASTPRSRAPTCSPRRRSAARASAWS